MRIALVSTHSDQTTGYSKVAYNLLRQMSTMYPRVKVFHFGFQRHPSKANIRKTPDGVICYDAANNEEPKEEGFGFNKIHEYLDMVNPNVVMIYNDPLIICRFLESMKHERGKSPYKLWLYVDQVYSGIAQPLIDMMNSHADRIYCFTEEWRKRYLEYGTHPDVRVLEHAVDSQIYSMLPPDVRNGVRASMNIPSDAVVFLNANRNSQRKRLDATIVGFCKLLSRRPTAPYYLIVATNGSPQAGAYYDCSRIYAEELKVHGLPLDMYANRFVFVDTSPPNAIGDDGINRLYNIADIGINTSDGEGYGLCQLEHMYTGAPQIVTDVGSYRSFLNENIAEFIPTGTRVYFSGTMPLGLYAPNVEAVEVANAMERCVDTLSEKKKAVREYNFKSWARVCDSWLEDIMNAM